MAKAKSNVETLEGVDAIVPTPKASGDTAAQTDQKSGSPSRQRLHVSAAYLHQAILIPQLLLTEKHLGKKGQPITLEWGPEGLWIIPNDTTKPTAIVPHANVACAVLK